TELYSLSLHDALPISKATTQILTLNANADLIGGTVGDKFTLRFSRLSADPLPPGLVDALKAVAEGGSATFADQVPFLVRQVSFRSEEHTSELQSLAYL